MIGIDTFKGRENADPGLLSMKSRHGDWLRLRLAETRLSHTSAHSVLRAGVLSLFLQPEDPSPV